PAPAAGDRTKATSPELVRVLRALADPTRLRILRQITRHPRSTQELAPIIALSEAGTSKHPRLPPAPRLVAQHREVYSVLSPRGGEPLEALGGDLRRYIHSRAAR